MTTTGGRIRRMAQTVTNTVIGIVVAESTANATKHGAKDRSSIHGVTTAESTSNAVTNTATAVE